MEEKKKIKISLKGLLILIFIFIILISLVIFINFESFRNNENESYTYRNGKSITRYLNSEFEITGKEVEYNIKTGYYDGSSECIENTFVTSFDELEEYINSYGEVKIGTKNVLEIFNEEFFENNTIAIEAHDQSTSNNSYEIDSVRVDGTEVNINMNLTTQSYGGAFAPTVEFNFIILEDTIRSAKFNIRTKRINNYWDQGIAYKPIIYLYPTEEIEVSVNLLNSEKITCSYPKYNEGWNVLAKPNGDLIDLNTKRNLYSLYYENENVVKFNVLEEGFIVKGEDSVKFLEEKLAILGLNEREAQEFIIYWLPKLESNKYNYIRFATDEEINKNMPLEINPKPDNIIRILMTFKGLEKPIDIKEQNLVIPQRNGFTVVEWGGTQIENK